MGAKKIAFCVSVMVAMAITTSVGAEEQSAERRPGRATRGSGSATSSDLRWLCDAHLCRRGQGSIVPYGRIELDGIYSNRNTNPPRSGQFNGLRPRQEKQQPHRR